MGLGISLGMVLGLEVSAIRILSSVIYRTCYNILIKQSNLCSGVYAQYINVFSFTTSFCMHTQSHTHTHSHTHTYHSQQKLIHIHTHTKLHAIILIP